LAIEPTFLLLGLVELRISPAEKGTVGTRDIMLVHLAAK